MRGKLGLFARVPPPFDVTSIAGLTGWWDASDSETLFDDTTGGSAVASDGAVRRWEDKSGSSRNWTASLSSSPTRRVSVRNSLDVVRFDGADDFMSGVGNTGDLISASQSTVFVVASSSSASTNSGDPYANEVVLSDEGGGNGFFAIRSNNTVLSYAYDGGWKEPSVSYSLGSWIVLTTLHSSGQLDLRKNGGSLATASNLFSRADLAYAAVLGANFSLEQYFHGDIGEIITCNVALSVSDRQAVESYLMTKWAIT